MTGAKPSNENKPIINIQLEHSMCSHRMSHFCTLSLSSPPGHTVPNKAFSVRGTASPLLTKGEANSSLPPLAITPNHDQPPANPPKADMSPLGECDEQHLETDFSTQLHVGGQQSPSVNSKKQECFRPPPDSQSVGDSSDTPYSSYMYHTVITKGSRGYGGNNVDSLTTYLFLSTTTVLSDYNALLAVRVGE